jgi:hypothetical protein
MFITHPVRQLLIAAFPPEQIAFALERVATLPQPPQLLTSAIVLTSHPLEGLLSQLANLQGHKQKSSIASDCHSPCEVEQGRKQFNNISDNIWSTHGTGQQHALGIFTLRNTYPVRQLLKTTCPAKHVAFALGRVAALPQPPQLLTSVIVLTSHPLAGLLSQLANLQGREQECSIASGCHSPCEVEQGRKRFNNI